jgi:predicted nuclease with TOPRIM domain
VLTQNQRSSICRRLAPALGEENAETLMAHLEDIVTKDFVRLEIASVRSDMKDEFAKINGRFGQVNDRFSQVNDRFGQVNDRFSQVDNEIQKVRTEMRTEFSDVRREITELRGEMTTGFERVVAEMRKELNNVVSGSIKWAIAVSVSATTLAVSIVGLALVLRR